MPAKTKFELKLGVATREAFGKALVELGKVNPNVVVLDADLSKSTYTAEFAKDFPDRFFECGIAEVEHDRDRLGPGVGRKDSVRVQLLRVPAEQRVRATARHRRVSQRESEDRRHAQRHFDRRRRTIADERGGSEPGLLAAWIHGDVARRRSRHDGSRQACGRSLRPDVHPHRPPESADDLCSRIRSSRSANPSS